MGHQQAQWSWLILHVCRVWLDGAETQSALGVAAAWYDLHELLKELSEGLLCGRASPADMLQSPKGMSEADVQQQQGV
jgi:hypothetical protein